MHELPRFKPDLAMELPACIRQRKEGLLETQGTHGLPPVLLSAHAFPLHQQSKHRLQLRHTYVPKYIGTFGDVRRLT